MIALLTGLPAMIIAAFNYVVDPIQYFRPASFYKPGIYSQERFLYPAVIRHQAFDSVVMGTSTAMTTRPSFANSLFGGHFIKLTMNGGRAYEQATVLRTAFAKQPLRTVVWGIDPHIWFIPFEERNDLYVFPEYLYKSDPVGVLRYYLLSRDIAQMSLTSLYNGFWKPHMIQAIDPDNVGNWIEFFTSRTYACREVEKQVSKFFDRNKLPSRAPLDEGSLAFYRLALNANFDQNLEPLIRDNPQTQFYLYTPPYSRAEAYSHAVTKPEILAVRQEFKERLQKLAADRPNVRYYDFEQWRDVTDNLDNYYDFQHYSREINNRMFAFMAANPGLPAKADWISGIKELNYNEVFQQCPPQG
ncbi:hypothetical protein [Bosea sp. FBZP-16]|uniref:hypothetical protein n=1 Tax=Bosea sp. FBZP-16 TaxID=2065382 RepID=UPI000C315CE2|nr:hypothetical protein [Bosea sp. FBZP-16]